MRLQRITLLTLALAAGCPAKPLVSCSADNFGCKPNPSPVPIDPASGSRNTSITSKGDPSLESRYSWGQKGCDGIYMGIRLTAKSIKSSEELSYGLAFSNRSSNPKTLVLFFSLDDTFRTRLVILGSEPGQKIIKPAVRPPIPTGAPFKIEVTLQPGETIEKPGSPLRIDPRLTGSVSVFVEYDHNGAEKCTAQSGTLELTIHP